MSIKSSTDASTITTWLLLNICISSSTTRHHGKAQVNLLAKRVATKEEMAEERCRLIVSMNCLPVEYRVMCFLWFYEVCLESPDVQVIETNFLMPSWEGKKKSRKYSCIWMDFVSFHYRLNMHKYLYTDKENRR